MAIDALAHLVVAPEDRVQMVDKSVEPQRVHVPQTRVEDRLRSRRAIAVSVDDLTEEVEIENREVLLRQRLGESCALFLVPLVLVVRVGPFLPEPR